MYSMNGHTQESRALALAEGAGGYVRARDAELAAIPRRALSQLARDGALVRVSRGVYALPGEDADTMYELQARFPRGVFSHMAALHLHDLAEGVPERWDMTFPRGYNTSAASRAGARAHSCAAGLHAEGIVPVPTMFGNEVACYRPERALCEILRGRGVGVEAESAAWREYLRRPAPDLPGLMRWADAFGVKGKAMGYIKALT